MGNVDSERGDGDREPCDSGERCGDNEEVGRSAGDDGGSGGGHDMNGSSLVGMLDLGDSDGGGDDDDDDEDDDDAGKMDAAADA